MPRVIFTTVPSGFNVSGDIDLSKGRLFAIGVPTLTVSAALAIQGNINQNSGEFKRMLDWALGSADLLMGVGVGSRWISIAEDFDSLPFARLELITAAGSFQTDTRTFTLLAR